MIHRLDSFSRAIPVALSLLILPMHADEAIPVWSPASFPDEEGFQTRRQLVIEGVANRNLSQYRRGFFARGDPGKYLPLHAMAKLILDPDDRDSRHYMNDDRSYREHYHFAAVNWSRFLGLFPEIITEETRGRYREMMRGYNYLNPTGTENHRTQWWTSANVLPHLVDSGTNNLSREETLRRAKETLRNYTRGLFAAGKGEWDSSTYLMFDVNGLLNIYDFSPDEEARLLARAALDWKIAAYALKYTDGIFTAPNQRGFAHAPFASIADQTGFVWWGGNLGLTPAQTREFRYAMHAVTSSWRPNVILTNIATRNVEGLPVEQRNTKPNYWHGHNTTPRPGATHETVYIHPRFTLGSLWNGHASQHSRFQIAVSSSAGAVSFTGGHPRRSDHNNIKTGIGFRDGISRYLQSVQSGPVYLAMARAPADEEHAFTFFTVPSGMEPSSVGDWSVFDVEGIQVAVRPLLGENVPGATPEDRRGNTEPLLTFPGHDSGFLVWVLDSGEDLEAKLAAVQLDAGEFVEQGRVRVRVPGVTEMDVTFNPDPDGDLHGNRAARAVINGEEINLADWNIYGGPFVHQTPGVLTVSDGREAFRITFTRDLPVYEAVPLPE